MKIFCRKEDFMFLLFISVFQFEDPLLREKWYFGEIDRMVGNEKLKKCNQVDNIFRSLFNITLYKKKISSSVTMAPFVNKSHRNFE